VPRSRNPSKIQFPDIEDLRSRLRFRPEEGSIHSGDVRMTLVHVPALASLRRELVDALGVDRARGVLTRIGYAAGTLDAQIVRKVRPKRSLLESFAVGPQLQSLEGTLRVELVKFSYDPARGRFYGEAFWKNSFELECQDVSIAPEPVCWMQAGYASGYTTAFVGKPCLVREVECRGAGARDCRVIGKTVEEWGDDVEELRFLTPEVLAEGKSAARRLAPRAGARVGARDPGVPDELVGASPSFHAACHRVRKAAATRATALFLGETGVGKEMFAHFLHRASPRARAPIVAVNCAAIPETLLEAELFGVEKGAYTGAVSSRPGRFERADGGTLFLDEVGTMPLAAQAKLLRVLQTGEIERVGDVRTRHVDVRVVAATNEDLAGAAAAGSFRRDLYYRLNVFPIHLPPLRERRDDIPLLMDHLLDKYRRLHDKRISGFTERAVAALLDYDYPGNIRELENMIESAVILSDDDEPLDASLLFASTPGANRPSLRVDPAGRLAPLTGLDQLAKSIVDAGAPVEPLFSAVLEQALRSAGGNFTHAAESVGLTRAQLAYRVKSKRER
jgi:DNA-binding NtrC family response regulator/predicted hydrocarbon binding protein